jgi:hypothetical protein
LKTQRVLDAFRFLLIAACFGAYEFCLIDLIRVMIEMSRGRPEGGWIPDVAKDYLW